MEDYTRKFDVVSKRAEIRQILTTVFSLCGRKGIIL